MLSFQVVYAEKGEVYTSFSDYHGIAAGVYISAAALVAAIQTFAKPYQQQQRSMLVHVTVPKDALQHHVSFSNNLKLWQLTLLMLGARKRHCIQSTTHSSTVRRTPDCHGWRQCQSRCQT